MINIVFIIILLSAHVLGYAMLMALYKYTTKYIYTYYY